MSEEMTAPCGCRMKKEGEIFFIEPCKMTCPTYLFVIEQSKKRNLLIMKRGKEND